MSHFALNFKIYAIIFRFWILIQKAILYNYEYEQEIEKIKFY